MAIVDTVNIGKDVIGLAFSLFQATNISRYLLNIDEEHSEELKSFYSYNSLFSSWIIVPLLYYLTWFQLLRNDDIDIILIFTIIYIIVYTFIIILLRRLDHNDLTRKKYLKNGIVIFLFILGLLTLVSDFWPLLKNI
jgi:hypothetical protein